MIKKLLAVVLLCTVLLLPAGNIKADVNDFVINKFSADYVIDDDAVGGSMTIKETIALTFSDQNHGIFRAIPQSYQGYGTKLDIMSVKRDGVTEKYETSSSNSNLVLKIGDADKTITGQHTYIIEYKQARIMNFENEPLFYWDINGTEWSQKFETVEATVSSKNGPVTQGNAKCFVGSFGAVLTNCTVEQRGDSLYYRAQNLSAGETLTVYNTVPGTFVKPGLKQKLTDNWASIVGITAGIGIVAGATAMWRRHGKDYAGKGVIVPEYEPPSGLTPGEVGLLADYSVDSRDISATLIDLAVRGYLKIYEEQSKFLMFTSKMFCLELLKTDFSGLRKHEETLLNALFPTPEKGSMLPLAAIDKASMSSAVQTIKSNLKESLEKSYGLIESSKALKPQVILWAPLGLLFGFGVITESLGSFIGFGLGLVALLAVASFMQRRSHAGVEAYEKIQGLKLYLNTAEKDRLAKLQSVDRPYAEPSKTVELFEALLPFAIALGVEKSWAKQFDSILKESPDWYNGGTSNAFTAGYIASSIGDATNSFATSFSASTTTSSSSGGSAGGGGGGGGGGGW